MTSWGVHDGSSWLRTKDPGAAPLLFDENYEAKPAFTKFSEQGKADNH
jgi:GH35 family endo-1,4-beta-xylanase